jgi:hypothetical protein
MEQNRDLESDWCIYSSLIFNKGAKNTQEEKES